MTAPTKHYWYQYPKVEGAASIWHVYLETTPNRGDSVLLKGMTGSGGSNPFTSIVDEVGNSYTVDKYQTGGQGAFFASARKLAVGGGRKLTITFSAPTTFTSFASMLCNNLGAGAPVTGGNNPNGTTLASASLNTTSLGPESFVVACFYEDSGQAITAPTRFTAPSGAVLWAPDGVDWESAGLYADNVASSSGFSLSLTSSNAFTSGVSAIVAYPVEISGTGPGNDIEIVQTQRLNFNTSKADPWPITTFTVDMPIPPSCDAISIMYTDGNIFHAGVPGNVSSSPANEFSAATPAVLPGNVAAIGFLYAKNAACSLTGSLTVTVTSAPAAQNIEFQLFIKALRNVRDFGPAQQGTGTLNTIPPVTQSNVLGSPVVTTERGVLILFGTQEVQQTPTTITASSGTFRQTMPDVGFYESFDLTHDAGDGSLFADLPGSFNFNTSYSDYEGTPGTLVVSGWAAVAIAVLPKLVTSEDIGAVTGSPYSFVGEAQVGAVEFVPGATKENGPGFVTGSRYSLVGEARTGGPEFVPGSGLGPGFVTGGSSSFTGEMATGAPDATGSAIVSAPIVTHTYTVPAPKIQARVAPTQVTHTYTSQTPQARMSVKPGAVLHTYTGQTPQVRENVAAPAATHTYTARVPTVVSGATVLPPAATHTYTARTPLVQSRVSPAQATHTYTARTPQVRMSVRPLQTTHTYTGNQPKVQARVAPAAVQHTYTARLPQIRAKVMPGAALHTYSGSMPAVIAGGTNSVAPPQATHTYSGRVPTVNARLTVAAVRALHTYTASVPRASASIRPPAALHVYSGVLPVVFAAVFQPTARYHFKSAPQSPRIGESNAAPESPRLGQATISPILPRIGSDKVSE